MKSDKIKSPNFDKGCGRRSDRLILKQNLQKEAQPATSKTALRSRPKRAIKKPDHFKLRRCLYQYFQTM